MEIDKEFWSTLFFTVLNILILYFILKKILFKPVSNFMISRTNKIQDALDKAEEAKLKVENFEKEHQERLKEAKNEGVAVINSYKQKAENEYNAIIEKAKSDAAAMVKNTKEQLSVEKDILLAEIKNDVTELVLNASSKVLDKNLDDEANRKLIDDFIKDNK